MIAFTCLRASLKSAALEDVATSPADSGPLLLLIQQQVDSSR